MVFGFGEGWRRLCPWVGCCGRFGPRPCSCPGSDTYMTAAGEVGEGSQGSTGSLGCRAAKNWAKRRQK